MNYSISSDLQSRLQSLSSLVHEDKRSSDAKSSEVEEIGNIILKKIYAEDSNLPTSARLYLEQIASSIIDDKWSDIPKPVEMKFDFQILKGVADALALASVGTTIDLFELFGLLMKIKGDEAYNLATISIMDIKLSLEEDKERFKAQEKSIQMELGAGIASGVLQCVQGVAQAGSNITSIVKTGRLGLKTKEASEATEATGNAKINFESALAERTAVTNKLSMLDNEITRVKATTPNKKKTIERLEKTKTETEELLPVANARVTRASQDYNKANTLSKDLGSYIDQKTNIERFKDQLRSSVISAVKGGFDVGVAFVRFAASKAKLEADMFEAAKNTTDRSANAMSEAAKQAAEGGRKALQCIEGIQQMRASSETNLVRA